MVSKLGVGKVQVGLGIVLVVMVIAKIVYSFYPFGRIFSFLAGFESSLAIIVSILSIILILEGLANIAEL
jgi:hypothetical protein